MNSYAIVGYVSRPTYQQTQQNRFITFLKTKPYDFDRKIVRKLVNDIPAETNVSNGKFVTSRDSALVRVSTAADQLLLLTLGISRVLSILLGRISFEYPSICAVIHKFCVLTAIFLQCELSTF